MYLAKEGKLLWDIDVDEDEDEAKTATIEQQTDDINEKYEFCEIMDMNNYDHLLVSIDTEEIQEILMVNKPFTDALIANAISNFTLL